MVKLLSDNLKENIIKYAEEGVSIIIISGYVGPSVIQEMSEIFSDVKIVYGMYGIDGINYKLHNSLLKLNKVENLNIYYSITGTHSKAYFLLKNNKIFKCFIGSANLSPNGLERDIFQEILIELDVFDETEMQSYINYIFDNSKLCEDIIVNDTKDTNTKAFLNPLTAIMPLYLVERKTQKKYTPLRSGLNWGNQNGNVSVSENLAMESYIKISANHIDKYPLLFPPIAINRKSNDGKITRKNDPIDIIWDDGYVMRCLLCGKGCIRNGRVYPKQITSTGDGGNSLMGEYIRKRMGLEKRHIITYEDLKRYGRDTIELTYIQEGVYSADFSV